MEAQESVLLNSAEHSKVQQVLRTTGLGNCLLIKEPWLETLLLILTGQLTATVTLWFVEHRCVKGGGGGFCYLSVNPQ